MPNDCGAGSVDSEGLGASGRDQLDAEPGEAGSDPAHDGSQLGSGLSPGRGEPSPAAHSHSAVENGS